MTPSYSGWRSWHLPETRGEAISDHEPFHVAFEGDRIVVTDRSHRQYLLTFRPYQRPPDPAVSTDYCPWVIDNDPKEGEIRCGPSCVRRPAPVPPSKVSFDLFCVRDPGRVAATCDVCLGLVGELSV
jgi:hypothetical protein